jgi:hypothetical protein
MKVRQFLLLIRHLLCCSSPVKVFAVIEERKHLRKKSKDPLLFKIWIFRSGQPDYDDNCRIFVVWFIFQSDTASELYELGKAVRFIKILLCLSFS